MKEDLEALKAQARTVADDVRLPIVADVLSCVVDNALQGGSFRYLIYDRLGFGPEAYYPLYIAGGQTITNNFSLYDQGAEGALPEALAQLEAMAKAAPMVPHPTLTNVAGEPLKWPSEERSALFSAAFVAQDLVNINAQLQESNRRLAARCEEFERRFAPAGETLPTERVTPPAPRLAPDVRNAVAQALALMEDGGDDRAEFVRARQLLQEALSDHTGL
jgi:hypothetical protein